MCEWRAQEVVRPRQFQSTPKIRSIDINIYAREYVSPVYNFFNLPQCYEISVKLRPAIVEALQGAATVAQIPFQRFLEELLESEAAARRLRTLPPPRVSEPPEPPRRPRDVAWDDLSGPEMGRYRIHL